MLINLKKDDYVLGFWLAAREADYWYCVAFKRNNEWDVKQVFIQRSEEYKKSGLDGIRQLPMVITAEKDEEEIIASIDKIFKIISSKLNYIIERRIIRSDIKTLFTILRNNNYYDLAKYL